MLKIMKLRIHVLSTDFFRKDILKIYYCFLAFTQQAMHAAWQTCNFLKFILNHLFCWAVWGPFPRLWHIYLNIFFFLTTCSWTHCQLVLTSQKWMTTWWMPSLNTSLLENLSVIKIFTKAVIIISKKRQIASTWCL